MIYMGTCSILVGYSAVDVRSKACRRTICMCLTVFFAVCLQDSTRYERTAALIKKYDPDEQRHSPYDYAPAGPASTCKSCALASQPCPRT